MLIKFNIPFESFLELPYYEYGWFIKELKDYVDKQSNEGNNEHGEYSKNYVNELMRQSKNLVKQPKMPKIKMPKIK